MSLIGVGGGGVGGGGSGGLLLLLYGMMDWERVAWSCEKNSLVLCLLNLSDKQHIALTKNS